MSKAIEMLSIAKLNKEIQAFIKDETLASLMCSYYTQDMIFGKG